MTWPADRDGGGLRVRTLVLAAGRGTRLRPLTDTVPKCLVPVGGIPLLERWEGSLLDAGIRAATVNTHHLADRVASWVEARNSRGEFNWALFHEPELLGSAGTIAANAELSDDADVVLVVYADNVSELRIDQLLHAHWLGCNAFTMALFHSKSPRACGIATLDEHMTIVAFEEKPEHPKGDLANAGVYAISPELWKEICGLRAFDLGFDVLPRLVGRMHGFEFSGFHCDVGTPESWRMADSYLESVARGER